MTVITLSSPAAPADHPRLPLQEAAQEWDRLSLNLEQLAEQRLTLTARKSALAGVAAAHTVRRAHPTAAIVVFTVRDGRPHLLSQIIDSEGRILPARRTGRWAEEVLGAVHDEDLAVLGNLPGIQLDTATLRITIDAVNGTAKPFGAGSATAGYQLLRAA